LTPHRKLTFLAAIILFSLIAPGRAYSFPWSFDMWVQPSADPYEKPVLHPQKSLSRKGILKIPREEIEEIARSPVEATPESIERGRELFSYNCVSCHGRKGLGDGTIILKGHGFYPVDLTSAATEARSDGYLYAYVVYGGKIMMPSYGENMPQEKNGWDVVNYVRHLQKESKVKEQEKQDEKN